MQQEGAPKKKGCWWKVHRKWQCAPSPLVSYEMALDHGVSLLLWRRSIGAHLRKV